MHLCRYVSLIFNQAGYPSPRMGVGSDKIRYSDIWAGAVVQKPPVHAELFWTKCQNETVVNLTLIMSNLCKNGIEH